MRRAITILGFILIALSPLPWVAILALPFLGLTFAQGALWALVLLFLAEGLFLIGAAIVAPGLYARRGEIWRRLTGRGPDRDA